MKAAAPPGSTLSAPEPAPAVSVNPVGGTTAGATVKVTVTVAAAYCPLAAWLALSTTVPAPVSVTILPAMVAGPLTIAYVTAPLDEDVALTAKGGLPNVWAGIGPKLRVGAIPVTVSVAEPLLEAN